MLNVTKKTSGTKAALPAARELTASELDIVAGGMMEANFVVGNDSWVIRSDGTGYAVAHIHLGK